MKSFLITMAASAFVLSANAHAATISYGGYTHDTTTDIVTGNGLEWLQWDRTLGESINSIQSQLGTIDGGGWRIASNTDMAHLFNAFDFGITFDTDENTHEQVGTGYTYPDSLAETDELFIAMFGDTYNGSFCYLSHCYKESNALFGQDPDGDLFYNAAAVIDDYQSSAGNNIGGIVALSFDGQSASTTHANYGIALVRDVAVVPVPAAVWLFGSGLLGLVGVARRKKAA